MIGDMVFAHPPARVWEALTRSEVVASWLMENDLRRLGRRRVG